MLRHTRCPRRILTTLATILAVGACDDPAEPEPEGLTEAEVVALIRGMSVVRVYTTNFGAGVDEPAAACPLGGVIDFSGSTAADAGMDTARTFRTDIAMVPQACRFATQAVTFTIDGAPSIRQVGTATVIGAWERVEFVYDLTGALDWQTDSPARSGHCPVDLDMSGEIDLPELESGDTTVVMSGNLSGNACGSSVAISLDS